MKKGPNVPSFCPHFATPIPGLLPIERLRCRSWRYGGERRESADDDGDGNGCDEGTGAGAAPEDRAAAREDAGARTRPKVTVRREGG